MKWFEEINRQGYTITEVAGMLHELSRAFELVGNEVLHTKLSLLANLLSESVIEINKAVSDHQDKDFRAAEQAATNVLEATLAGIPLTSRMEGGAHNHDR